MQRLHLCLWLLLLWVLAAPVTTVAADSSATAGAHPLSGPQASPGAAKPVELGSGPVTLDQGQLVLLEDPERQLDLKAARNLYAQGAFKPIPTGIAEGYSESAFWAVVTLKRTADVPAYWAMNIRPSYLDRVDIYLVQHGRLVEHIQLGDLLEDPEHDRHYRLHLGGTDIPVGETRMFIRLQTASTSVMLLTLLPEAAVPGFIDMSIYLEGLLIGLLVVILVVNLLNGVMLRNRLFFHFLSYESGLVVTLLLATGMFRVLFPSVGAEQANILMQYAVMIAGLLAFVFFYRLLSFPFPARLAIDVAFWVGIGCSLWGTFQVVLGQFTFAMAYINWFLVFYPPVVMVILASQWSGLKSEQRVRVGGFYVFGLFVTINALFVSGVLGMTRYTAMIAPLMILSSQLTLHFLLVLLVRKSERRLHQAEELARQAQREAEVEREQRQSHETFLAMFSHEVRTPLAVIDSAAQSLTRLENKSDSRAQREARHQRIRDAVKRIGELLQMSIVRGRASDHEAPETVHSLDLLALTEEIVDSFSPAERWRIHVRSVHDSIQLKTDVPSQPLGIIMRNLIDNALKYSPVERPVIISVHIGKVEAYWSVQDYGKGLTDHVRKHMFKRYFRADEGSDVPGLGLGLHVVKELVERYELELVFASNAQEGTTFTCCISTH